MIFLNKPFSTLFPSCSCLLLSTLLIWSLSLSDSLAKFRLVLDSKTTLFCAIFASSQSLLAISGSPVSPLRSAETGEWGHPPPYSELWFFDLRILDGGFNRFEVARTKSDLPSSIIFASHSCIFFSYSARFCSNFFLYSSFWASLRVAHFCLTSSVAWRGVLFNVLLYSKANIMYALIGRLGLFVSL